MIWLKAVPAWAWVVLAALALGFVAGGSAGLYFAAGHYRPLLDSAQDERATAGAARDNLLALAEEQGKALADLAAAGEAREAKAKSALAQAHAESKQDYVAAGRIKQERTGGDPVVAAQSIIDQELGL